MTFHTETDVSASIFGHHWTEAGALSEKSLGPRTASVALQLATCNVQRDSPFSFVTSLSGVAALRIPLHQQPRNTQNTGEAEARSARWLSQ